MGKQALDFSQFLTQKFHFLGFGYAHTIHCLLACLFSISIWLPGLLPCAVALHHGNSASLYLEVLH